MSDRVSAALTHRREDLLEIGTGIDGNDPGTGVDRDSACPGVHAIGDDRADHRHEVGKVERHASYRCRLPDDVASDRSTP